MKQIVVYQEKCTACRECEMACSFEHTGAFNPALSRIRIQEIQAAQPDAKITWLVFRPSYESRARQEHNDLISHITSVRDAYGGVDILVNNAGLLGGASVLEMPLERWNRQIAVNLTGTFLCTKHVARLMVAQGRRGSIIVIVSTAGHQGQAGNIGYCTSKSGLLNFTRAAAMDLAKHRIRVNSLTPTATDVRESHDRAVKLERAMAQLRTERRVVVTHYSPIADTVKGEPVEIYPYLGNSRLGEVVDRMGANLVVHGHAHHGSPQGHTAKGVPVYNCCIEVMRRSAHRGFALVEV